MKRLFVALASSAIALSAPARAQSDAASLNRTLDHLRRLSAIPAPAPVFSAVDCGMRSASNYNWEVRLNVVADSIGVIRSVRIDPSDPAASARSPLHTLAEQAVRLMVSDSCNRSIPPDRAYSGDRNAPSFDMLFRG